MKLSFLFLLFVCCMCASACSSGNALTQEQADAIARAVISIIPAK